MKTAVLLVCLFLVDFKTNAASHGYPKITGGGRIDLRQDEVHTELKCHVETLTESVAWIYNDTTFFTCDYPYRAGTCMMGLDNSYEFSTNEKENMFMVKFKVKENENDGNWTCSHGNDTTHPFDVDTGRSPAPPTVTVSKSSLFKGDNLTITCTAEMSDDKLTRFEIYTSDGTNRVDLLKLDDPSNVTYTVTRAVDCKIVTYMCCVYNHYGNKCTSHQGITVNCSVEIRKGLTVTNVTAYEGDGMAHISLMFTGIPMPEHVWYRLDAGSEMNLTDYRLTQNTRIQCRPQGTACMSLIVHHPIEADSGYYVVHVNASRMIDSHTFHLTVMPARSNGTTASTTESMMPCTAASTDELTFGQGIGIGIGIGLGLLVFTAGTIYGCRNS